MNTHSTNVDVIGSGLMGTPMTKRLLHAGFNVYMWNRTPEKANALKPSGATALSSPAKLARKPGQELAAKQKGPAMHVSAWQRWSGNCPLNTRKGL